jgi:AcrR family transcriptional regulator
MSSGLEEILSKSSRLMATRGFHGTTMRDLASETNRSLSGLYHYFRSKEELLYLINAQGFTTLTKAWETIEAALDGPREKLYAFVYLHVTYFSDHMNEMRVMTWGTQEMRFDRARVIRGLKDQYLRSAHEAVAAMRAAEGNRDLDEQQIWRETYLLFGMMNWIPSWHSTREHGTVGQLVDDIYRTFVSGVARAGHDEADLVRLRGRMRELYTDVKPVTIWRGADGRTIT